MIFRWLKSILPKGLFGRTVLILILPVIVIQLVVSVMFIQRHFDGVARQLTTSIALELHYLQSKIENASGPVAADPQVAGLTRALGFELREIAPEALRDGAMQRFDDFTGKTVIRTLRAHLPGVRQIDLATDTRVVSLQLETARGPFEVRFDRVRVSASNPHQLLVLMIGVSLIITLIAFVFLKNQVRPIRQLARAAEAFGRGQNLRYKVSGAAEVRQAGQAFLDMRDRIERQIEQRTLMLSGVSHDLRTPLTRLKLGLSLQGGEEAEEMIRDVDDMEQMLDEFLAFSRGDSLEQAVPVDLAALARQAVEDAPGGDGRITLEIGPEAAGMGPVSLRPNAVRRALDNLIGNALRFGTRCRLTVLAEPEQVILRVEDDGPGIPASFRERALRPFERLDSARNQNRSAGVGLGLAIATDIASSHGGALVLGDSADLGGLMAELRLPR